MTPSTAFLGCNIMSYVQQNHDGPLAQVVLDRPDKNNAFNEAMIDELIKTFSDLNADKDIHVIVMSSSGKHFCAGADLHWMKKNLLQTQKMW